MTTRMVAPEPDMLSAVVQGVNYEIKKDDRFGRVVDVHDAHIKDFLAIGFIKASDMGYQIPVELLPPAPTEDELKKIADDAAEKEAAAKLAADQAEQDRLEAEAKADEPAKKGKGK